MNLLNAPDDRRPDLGRWARLRANIPTVLRRGGWYPVLSAGLEEAVLQVRGTPTIFPRDAVEIVQTRPAAWSVVPAEWGGPYLVCPECAERVRGADTSGWVVCRRCGGSFSVGL